MDNINTWGGRLWGRCLTGSTNGSGSFCKKKRKKKDLQDENYIVIFLKEKKKRECTIFPVFLT